MKNAKMISMILLAASVLVTCALAVENLVLACVSLKKSR